MLQMMLAIAPIFLLIVLGHALRRGGIPSLEFWNLNDKLVYWVLFPALLFHKMATMELTGDVFSSFAMVVYAGVGSALVFGLLLGRLCRLAPALWTSMLQGSARHNTFIALAVCETVFGAEGLALAAVITALLIPVTNFSVVTLMVTILRGNQSGGVFGAVFRDLVRNPLLIAVLAGIAVNLSGVDDIPILYDMTRILGDAALPIVLLCVGANIRIRAMTAAALPVGLSIVGKMLVFPLAIAVVARLVGLDPLATSIAMVYGAVPSAPGAYTLARQMGGDAPAMAAIVTIQTAVAFVTMPLTVLYAQDLLNWAFG